jgi:hypothetical protein
MELWMYDCSCKISTKLARSGNWKITFDVACRTDCKLEDVSNTSFNAYVRKLCFLGPMYAQRIFSLRSRRRENVLSQFAVFPTSDQFYN